MLKKIKEVAKKIYNQINETGFGVKADMFDNPDKKDFITFIQSLGRIIDLNDKFVKAVIKKFLNNIANGFDEDETLDLLEDFIQHDFTTPCDVSPKTFIDWFDCDEKRVRYIKQAIEEFNITSDSELLRTAIRQEEIYICNEVLLLIRRIAEF